MLAVHLLCQDILAELVEHHTVYDTLHGSGTEFGIVALLGEEFQGSGSHLESDAVGSKHLLDRLDLQAHYLLDLHLVERGEHYDLVDTVEELGAYGLLEQFKHLILTVLNGLLSVLGGHLGEIIADEVRSHVGGHDDYSVLEVDQSALVVG